MNALSKNSLVRTVLLIDQHSQWALAYPGAYKNVRVQTRSFEPLLVGDSVEQGLRQWALSLLHYDMALVAVSPENLSWIRSQLHYARSYLNTPIIAVVNNLQPVAIQDLLDAGAADFIFAQNLLTELPIRVKLLQQRLNTNATSPYEALPAAVASTAESQVYSHFVEEEANSLDAYTAAVASRYAAGSHSFKQAKKSVVQRFETAYIRAALVRNQGNITRAARAAQKHRRSFWELMRKHNIDADIYRVSACPDQ